MDFTLPEGAGEFRKEVRAFLDREITPEFWAEQNKRPPEYRHSSREFTKKLAQKGWLGVGWPKEYGGLGKSHFEQYAFAEEMGYSRAPLGFHLMAVNIMGPTLMIVGSPELKREFLPKILNGDIQFCIGYTEPGAGSDLASLQTRAEEDGDYFVINGSKIFTTAAEVATHCWLGARTNPDAPKHRGISLFIIPMTTPGMTIKPLWCLAGMRANQVFFDNVRIPRTLLVGERDKGFYHIAVALDFERIMMGWRVSRVQRAFDDLMAAIKAGAPRSADGLSPQRRHQLAELALELEVARLMAIRVVWMIQNGLVPNTEASMLKVFSTDIQARAAHVAIGTLGLFGSLIEGSKWVPLEGELAWLLEGSILGTVGGGTNEIQRNIIATRGLGLPRG